MCRTTTSQHGHSRRGQGPIPGGELVLLLAGPGSSDGGQIVDRTHAVDGGVELLQLLPDVVQLLGVGSQVAGVCLTGFTAPFFA